MRERISAKKRTPEQTEAEIQYQMKCNKCTYDEAVSIVKWDDAIEAGEKPEGSEITKEQKAAIRDLTHTARTNKKSDKPRERKIDPVKKELIEKLQSSLQGAENVSVKNEAEISFVYKGENFTIKLTKHR